MKRFVSVTCFLAVVLAVQVAFVRAQTTEFTYQGQLQSSAAPANGNFDFEFLLFDAVSGGAQVGTTVTRSSVAVASGTFAVKLDFGSQFPGANRFLEIRVRLSGSGALTTLTPRQSVGSAPYSVKSITAETAANATNATTAATANNALNLGGVAANQYVQTSDPRLTDARPPTAGSANYIQNTISPQASNFNVSGTGTANVLNATSHFSLNNIQVLKNGGSPDNMFVGYQAGNTNSTGTGNAFFGTYAGSLNASGLNNSYFGYRSGDFNVGSGNTLIGALNTSSVSGFTTTNSTSLGYSAFLGNGLSNATAIGYRSFAAASNTIVLGSINGVIGATADTNVGIGINAPASKLHVNNGDVRVSNGSIRVTNGGIFIANPGTLVITSPNGACWGITVGNTGLLSTFPVTPCP